MANHKPLILIADDDPDVLKAVQFRLGELGYRIHCAANKAQLLEQLSQEEPVLLLLDLRFGKDDGVEVLCELLRQRPRLCVVLFTSHASVETAVSAIKLGAFDYLTKPLDISRFRVVVEHAIEQHVLQRRLERLEKVMGERESVQTILGDSPAINQVRELILGVAGTDATVMILGETGTGKELVARMLHHHSSRQEGPFVPVNMAALPRELAESTLFGHEKGAFTGADKAQPGCCEMANKGTLFLDEIGEMDLALQAKLLRFLQERVIQRVGASRSSKVDVRVVAATNRDLQAHIREGRFREDLYYRLHVIPIVVPPLRDRPQDIPVLASHFLQRAALRYQKNLRAFTPEALRVLTAYHWPGNVRQLENVVERVAILGRGPDLKPEDLPPDVQQPGASVPAQAGSSPPRAERERGAVPHDVGLRTMDQMEKQAIVDALHRTHGSVTQAAKLLGLGHATVYRKIKLYGIGLGRG